MSELFKGIEDLLTSIDHRMIERKKYASFRYKYLSPGSMLKQAFDARHLDQQNDANPRRNLQYYQRSEAFVDDDTSKKIALFFKVKKAADEIRDRYIGEPDWLDSYTRILCNALDQTLRMETKDMDYSRGQVKYLSELLDVRYRLSDQEIDKSSGDELKTAILNKDEKLVRLALIKNYQNPFQKTNSPNLNTQAGQEFLKIAPQPRDQDMLMEKLFGVVKADKNNRSVKRTVSITIEDSVADDKQEEEISPKAE